MDTPTFIIPTIGRDSLVKSLDCLLNQSDKEWKAIVVFDGLEPNIKNPDSTRITFLTRPKKTGKLNHGGEVRNYGMERVETSWIAFLDDDDTICKDYVALLKEEIKKEPNLDVVIFRMQITSGQIIPSPYTVNNFQLADVGISFAMKTQCFKQNYKFVPSQEEDFMLLFKLRQGNKIMLLSKHVTYFVRIDPKENLSVDRFDIYINDYIIQNVKSISYHNIDVTSHFTDSIFINRNINFNTKFGDPLPGTVKYLKITYVDDKGDEKVLNIEEIGGCLKRGVYFTH